MADQAVVNGVAGAHLLGDRRLEEHQVDVLPVVQGVERAGGGRVERDQEFVGRHPANRRPLDRHIAVDAVIVEAARHTLGQQLAAAEGASGNGDNGHGWWRLVNGSFV